MLKTIPTSQPMPAHSPTLSSTPIIEPNSALNKDGKQKMKTIFAIAALVAFIGLASLAVLISQKQQGGAPVAPNAPESKPKAYIEKPQTCSLTFEIPAQCNSVCLISDDCQKINPDWVCVDPEVPIYPSGVPTPSVYPTSAPGAIMRCRLYANSTSETCELAPTVTPSATPTPTEGPSPTPTPTPTEGPSPTPTPTEEVTPTPSPTPTTAPTPTEGPTPTLPPGITVNPTTPGEPPTYTVITTVRCNEACSKNADCSNASHICYNGACRLDANPEDAYCRMKTGETQVVVNVLPTRTPVIEKLYEAGPADWGNYLKVGFGALGVGALLLLFL